MLVQLTHVLVYLELSFQLLEITFIDQLDDIVLVLESKTRDIHQPIELFRIYFEPFDLVHQGVDFKISIDFRLDDIQNHFMVQVDQLLLVFISNFGIKDEKGDLLLDKFDVGFLEVF